MTDLVWPVVALIALGLAYDLVKRAIAGHQQAQLNALAKELWATVDAERKRFDEHEKLFNDICLSWRTKVGELEKALQKAVTDATNELAGILAQATDSTQKGWR